MSERCVCCGAEIPEGRQVCPTCEAEAKRWHIPLDMFEDKEDEDNGDQRN